MLPWRPNSPPGIAIVVRVPSVFYRLDHYLPRFPSVRSGSVRLAKERNWLLLRFQLPRQSALLGYDYSRFRP